MTEPDNSTGSFEVTFGDSTREFKDASAAIEWLKGEIEPFTFILTNSHVKQCYSKHKEFNGAARAAIKGFETDGAIGASECALRDEATKKAFTDLSGSPTLCLRSSSIGAFILELKEERGEFIAGAAALCAAGIDIDFGRASNVFAGTKGPTFRDYLEGTVRAIAFRLGYDRYAESARKIFDELINDARVKVAAAEAGLEKAAETAREVEETSTQRDKRVRDLQVKAIRQFRSERDRSIQESNQQRESMCQDTETRLSGLEDLYREKLALMAPVQYWRSARTKNFIMAGVWGVALLITLGTGGWWLITKWSSLLQEVNEFGQPEYWMMGIVGVSAAILAFIVRFLSRMTISALHMGSEASQRAVMVETYLALLEGDHVSEDTDRRLILGSLFRPVHSGLTKDVPSSLPAMSVSTRSKE